MEQLYTLVSGVTKLANSTGTSVSTTYPDPTSVSIPLPAAWIAYAGSVPQDKIQGGVVPKQLSLKNIFVVMVYLDNTQGQDALINAQLPILDAVVEAIRGVEATATKFRFNFEGQRLHSVTAARLAYEQRYSVVTYS